MFCVGPSIEIENNLCAVDLDVGHHHARTGLGRKPLVDHHVLIASLGWFQLAVGLERQALVAARKRAVGESLLRLQIAFQQNSRLGVHLGLWQIDVRWRHLPELPVHRPSRYNWPFAAAGINGDHLSA